MKRGTPHAADPIKNTQELNKTYEAIRTKENH